jgi:hypothetical protein
MKTLPLVRQYHPDITNTDLDIYKIKNKVFASPIENHPDPFQVTDRLGINQINDTKIRTVVYNSKGLFYVI